MPTQQLEQLGLSCVPSSGITSAKLSGPDFPVTPSSGPQTPPRCELGVRRLLETRQCGVLFCLEWPCQLACTLPACPGLRGKEGSRPGLQTQTMGPSTRSGKEHLLFPESGGARADGGLAGRGWSCCRKFCRPVPAGPTGAAQRKGHH